MARTDLSTLLDKIDADEAIVPQYSPSGVAVEAEILSSPVPGKSSRETAQTPSAGLRKQQRGTSKKQSSPSAPVPVRSLSEPLYLQLVRKETRLREEQYETLTEHARKLNRGKAPGVRGRITENTLIRIAVDLLIPHLGEMKGNDEDQLRESVSNRV